jgi:hypothetical protein
MKYLSALVLCVTTLAASGLAGAHGAPEAENVPSRRIAASIERNPQIDGFNAMIIDAPSPAILVTYRGEETAMIQGTEGEPFLLFTGQRVMANAHSRSWQKLGRHQPVHGNGEGEPSGGISWVEVSGSGSYGWVDPRLSGELLRHSGASNGMHWSIPVTTASTGTTAVTGRMRSVPVQ